MARKRMFSNQIVESDAFTDMPLSSQALYFHLCMNADDDGFLNNPKKIQRMVGASDDDLKLLLAKRFLLIFDSDIMVIKHWRMNNTLRKDRYVPTVYEEEFKQLRIKENGAYSISSGLKTIEVKSEIKEPEQVKTAKIEIDEFYEKIWELYPIKKGKGQVSDTQKKKLFKIGFEELSRCVQRFIEDKKDTDKQFWMHGSTFFNSGYVDYLDKNTNKITEEVTEHTEENEEEAMNLWGDD